MPPRQQIKAFGDVSILSRRCVLLTRQWTMTEQQWPCRRWWLHFGHHIGFSKCLDSDNTQVRHVRQDPLSAASRRRHHRHSRPLSSETRCRWIFHVVLSSPYTACTFPTPGPVRCPLCRSQSPHAAVLSVTARPCQIVKSKELSC